MRIGILSVVLVISTIILSGQKREIKLGDIGMFTPRSYGETLSMKDGEHYSKISINGRAIEIYAYASGEKTGVLMDLTQIEDHDIKYIQGYEINNQESRILFYTNRKKLYRRTFSADYYLYDIVKKKLIPLADEGQQQAASFSPDGDRVAYIKNNNIHLVKIRFGTESLVTTDGAIDKIINGVPDWVYEEEFAMNKAYEWSPDGAEIAYLKFEESDVHDYSFPLYKASFPEIDSCEIYPGEYSFKYPKAGTKNAIVSVCVFNIKNRTTKVMDTGDDKDIYIPRIKWSTLPNELGVVRVNRLQNQFELLLVNSASTVGHVILTDRNDRYFEEEVYDNWEFLSDGSGFIYMGESDGYYQLYHYSMAGILVKKVTSGDWDVTEYLGYNPHHKMIYYQSAEPSPLKRNIYEVRIDGKNKRRLSPEDGFNSATFSENWNYYINEYSNNSTPDKYSVYDIKGRELVILEDNGYLKELTNDYQLAVKKFIEIPNRDGLKLNAWMLKPNGFDSTRSYPLLFVQYSGTAQQYVKDEWGVGWEQYLAGKGYIVVGIDPRGTGFRGEDFRKALYLNMGIKESDDLIDAAKYLGKLDYVDSERIGIWGWSHGGYMTLMCMSRSDVFKMGVCIAAVTHWKYYDTAYTERYMKRPYENGNGYFHSSPINLVKDLDGKLLLVYGTADDNVHFQNMMEYVDALVQADKQFDMFVYPNRNHNLRGGNTYSHLYKMMSNYIFENL